MEYPQGTNSVQDSSPSKTSTNAVVIASIGISKIQLDTTIKNSIASALQSEAPYSQILKELEEGARQTVLNNLIFKRMNSLLVVHDQKQDDNLDFWRIVVPEDKEIKERLIQELHSTPYSAHPGI